MVYEISEKINGMIRSPNDGVHLETPPAQTESDSQKTGKCKSKSFEKKFGSSNVTPYRGWTL